MTTPRTPQEIAEEIINSALAVGNCDSCEIHWKKSDIVHIKNYIEATIQTEREERERAKKERDRANKANSDLHLSAIGFRERITALEAELEPLRRDSKTANDLCRLLIDFAGETGTSEGAVEVLTRKLAQLAALRAENDKQADKIAEYHNAYEGKKLRVYALEAALREFGQHKHTCPKRQWWKFSNCDCGLDAALPSTGAEPSKKQDLRGLINWARNQKDLPAEYARVINDNFWDLVDTTPAPKPCEHEWKDEIFRGNDVRQCKNCFVIQPRPKPCNCQCGHCAMHWDHEKCESDPKCMHPKPETAGGRE